MKKQRNELMKHLYCLLILCLATRWQCCSIKSSVIDHLLSLVHVRISGQHSCWWHIVCVCTRVNGVCIVNVFQKCRVNWRTKTYPHIGATPPPNEAPPQTAWPPWGKEPRPPPALMSVCVCVCVWPPWGKEARHPHQPSLIQATRPAVCEAG